MSQSPGERLLLFRKQLGLKQKEFAAELGVAAGGIGFVERDERLPSREFLGKLSKRYNLSADWLLHGRGDMLMKSPSFRVTKQILNPMRTVEQMHEAGRKRRQAQSQIDVDAFSVIGSFEITLASGPGLVVMSENTEDSMAFTKSFLARHRVDPNMAGLIRATDDSMEPFAPRGSRVLVDFSARDRFTEGLHIFRHNGSVQVRQLLPLGDEPDQALQQVVVIGANPHTSTVIKGSALDDLEIIGRVVTVISDI